MSEKLQVTQTIREQKKWKIVENHHHRRRKKLNIKILILKNVFNF